MQSTLRRLAALSACTLLVSLAPAQELGHVRDLHPTLPPQVWTVDAGGGADFVDLPPAIATARKGDVLLVAPGDYSAFTLQKGLTILGDGGVPRVIGRTRVSDLPAGQVASFRSLELVQTPSNTDAALRLASNAGTVWIEDCLVRRELAFLYGPGPSDAALVASGCADVVLVRTQVVSSTSDAYPLGTPTGAGLHASSSTVQAYDSLFQGLDVLQGAHSGSSPRLGGNGATLSNATLYSSGSMYRGGQGSESHFIASGSCRLAGQGGAGLDASAASAAPVTVSCTFQGGPGGDAGQFCNGGPAGLAFKGPLQQEAIPARTYALESPVRAGTSYQLEAHGLPGEFVWSAFAESLAPTYVPLYFGTQLGALPVTLVFEGTTDGSGALVKSVPVPPLHALASFERLWAQGLFFDPLANAYLASPSLLVVVR